MADPAGQWNTLVDSCLLLWPTPQALQKELGALAEAHKQQQARTPFYHTLYYIRTKKVGLLLGPHVRLFKVRRSATERH